mgnify:FL=1
MPFPLGKTEKGILHTKGKEGTSSTSEIDITLVDKITSEFINQQFMYFAEELRGINIEQGPEGIWKLKEAESKPSKISKRSTGQQRKAHWEEVHGGPLPEQKRRTWIGGIKGALLEDEYRDVEGKFKEIPVQSSVQSGAPSKSVSTLSALRRQ